jgi:hypothetical protein
MPTGGKQKQQAPQPTTQTVQQETIPKFLQPYVTDVASRAQALSNRPYQPYKNQRIAGFDPMQLQAQQGLAGMQTPEEFAQARALMQDPGRFGQQEADFYMSPYQSQVTDIAARKMQEEAARQQMQANLSAAKQGTYGGGRQAVLEGMRGRDLMTGTGDLYAQQRQASFLNAQEQFERDRQARMMAGQGLMSLGTGRQAADIQRLGAVGEAGKDRQMLDQSKLETAYQDFLRQRDYPMEQLGFYSNIVRGLPAPVSSTSTTYAPTPSTLNQLVGLAGAAASGYSAFNK